MVAAVSSGRVIFPQTEKVQKASALRGTSSSREIKRGQLHEERLKLLKLIRVIADEVQLYVR